MTCRRGVVIARWGAFPGAFKRRRSVEFLGFMATVVAAFPDRELHVILDNLNTHKKNERWLKKHPRVHFHFTPTRASYASIRWRPDSPSYKVSR